MKGKNQPIGCAGCRVITVRRLFRIGVRLARSMTAFAVHPLLADRHVRVRRLGELRHLCPVAGTASLRADVTLRSRLSG